MRTEQEKTKGQKIADFADKSLLIVDDDGPLRMRLSRAMEKKGFQVMQAESVKDGIIKANKSPPAFAVVDLRLNDGNGLEVIKEIQKLKKESKQLEEKKSSTALEEDFNNNENFLMVEIDFLIRYIQFQQPCDHL